MRLQDKAVIVTGSTTGIGKAIALRCAAEGACVVVHGLEEGWGREVVGEIGASRAALLVGDLCEDGIGGRLVQLALQRFGRLDAVVNNAAIVASSDIHRTDKAMMQRLFEVNATAPMLLIKAALPHLAERRGSVLNIGSVNAYSGEPNLMAYSMSKGALMTLTRNLGDTLFRTHGVRVNQINPGWVLTEKEKARKREHGLAEDWYRDLPEVYAPAGRILWPEEIATAAVYLLEDACGPVSGQVLDLEQHPFIGRNPPKDGSTIPTKK